MFKSARWRSEKNKIKAVFKLQFHATQVPKLPGDALMISVIPVEVGRPTVRLEKATVRDGSCSWETPVYETIKFMQDSKTGKILERIYQFRVSTGLSKAGVVGEVSIDFAEYAEATKPSSVSLPLKNSNYDAVLHVSILRMQENVDQREAEESEDTKMKQQDRTLRAHLSFDDTHGSTRSNSTEDGHNVEPNGNDRTTSGSDITLSSSESSSGFNTPRELGLKNNIHHDSTAFLPSLSFASVPQKPISNAAMSVYQEHQRSQWEWTVGSAHELSTDDSISSSQDALQMVSSQHDSDVMVENLRSELHVLAKQAKVSELELQTLRKQIVKEGKRGQELSREVVSLKEERDALKVECEKLRGIKNHTTEAKVKSKFHFENGDPRALLEELRQELDYEKDLNANLRLQLQKTQDSNSELILVVQDLDEMLEQKNREISNICRKSTSENDVELQETISNQVNDEEQKALEELVMEHRDTKETHLLEQKIIDLYSEIEIYRRDKDELETQMEQLALDYEILKQENHDILYKLEQSQLQEQLRMQYECSPSFDTLCELETQIENLENQLSKQSKELSDSSATIKELETQVKSLEEELEKQAQNFETDLDSLMHAKVEQEQRAIRAEEALRMTRWKNASTAERLQEEFKRLSMQMASSFDANEKLATKALTEATELRLQKSNLEALLHKAEQELQSVRDSYEAKLLGLSNQIDLKTSQIEQMMMEIEDNTKRLEHQKKHKEEVCGDLSREILTLRADAQRLKTENEMLSEQAEHGESVTAEMEQMKTSMKETELLVQRGDIEKNELEGMLVLARTEVEKSVEKLNSMKYLKDEKEKAVKMLKSEVEKLTAQYNDLKKSMSDGELEKEKLRKQVLQLKADLKKKDDALSSIEKKLKDSNARPAVLDGTKAIQRSNKSPPVPRASKEVTSLKEKIKLLEGQIKLKEAALEKSSNTFLEKEKDLLNKIEELESRVGELHQNSASFFKVAEDSSDISPNGRPEEGRNAVDDLSGMACRSEENGMQMSFIKSNDVISEEKTEVPTVSTKDQRNLNELLTEMALLNERNRSMEGELKEMQDRYSEISLKFAEVEGERQKLVMTVRNLKNAMKC